MATQIQIIDRVQIPNRGTTIMALAMPSEGTEPIRSGDRFIDSSTEHSLTIRALELIHTAQPLGAGKFSMLVDESTPGTIQPGMLLTKQP